MATVRVLIADDDPQQRKLLKNILYSRQEIKIIGVSRNGRQCVDMTLRLKPHVILMDASMPVMDGFEATQKINQSVPDAMIIMLCEEADPASLRQAMLVGAREYLIKPLQPGEVLNAVDRVCEIRKQLRAAEARGTAGVSHSPQIITVSSGRGGVGKTTIATNLAIALLQESSEPVVLLDMDLQFGDVATALNVNPKRTATDFLPFSGELDIELLESYMMSHDSGIKVLIASSKPYPVGTIDPLCLENIINILKCSYRYIVVDMPSMLDETMLHLLLESDYVLVVTTLHDIPSIRNARLFCETVRELPGNPRQKMKVIINRVSKHDVLRTEDVEKSTGCPVAAHIVNDSKSILSSINRGEAAIVTYPHSAVVEGIRRLAKAIIEESS